MICLSLTYFTRRTILLFRLVSSVTTSVHSKNICYPISPQRPYKRCKNARFQYGLFFSPSCTIISIHIWRLISIYPLSVGFDFASKRLDLKNNRPPN